MLDIAKLSTDYSLPRSHVEILDLQRPPGWRLQEADELRRLLEDNPHGRIRHKDPLVTRLANFLFRWHNVVGESETEQHRNRIHYLSRKYADLLWSFPIANQPIDYKARLELEARLLAGQDTLEIASIFQVPQRMIDIYHSCFFEVNHRLPNKAYIMTHCLSNEADTIENQPKDFVVKFFAYLGGVHVMEPFLYNYPTNLAVPSSPAQLRDYFKEVFRQTLARRGIYMASFFAPTRFDVSDFVSTVRQMHQVDEEAVIAGAGGGAMESADIVHSLVAAIGWTHGLEGRNQAINTYGSDIVGSPRQLSTEEKVKLKLGEKLKDEKEIKDWKFPPPRKKKQTHEGKVVKKEED
jgi:hypothetical protein